MSIGVTGSSLHRRRYANFCMRINVNYFTNQLKHKPQNIEKHFTPYIPAWCVKQPDILFDLHSWKNLNQIHTYLKMISDCKVVIRIINKFILD